MPKAPEPAGRERTGRKGDPKVAAFRKNNGRKNPANFFLPGKFLDKTLQDWRMPKEGTRVGKAHTDSPP